MNTKRVFASLCLAASSCALFTAASVSVGDQPGVVRLAASQQGAQPPVPAPPVREFPDGASGPVSGGPASDAGTASMAELSHPAGPAPVQSYPMQGMPMDSGFATPSTYDPYFESSGGVTEAPVLGRMAAPNNPLFGPSVTFESNFKDGLGFSSAYHRANVRVPYHVVPGSSVLMADMSTSITNRGNYVYNFGAIWRNYDASRNRIFGWNAYFDMDDGQGNADWKRFGFGMESLGKYLDFRANGYVVTGDDSFLMTDNVVGDLRLSGSNVYRVRNQTRENAYSGVDAETGGPLPYLGRRGINGYVGGYYLDNDTGFSTVGVSARVEALITESVTANFRYTQDDTFGSNGWVSVAYQIPNYRERTIFQPKSVHSRLADPVYRSNRIHTNIDEVNTPELVMNEKTGRNYRIAWVNPNSDDDGVGTMENPYGSLQLFAANNDPSFDVIRVVPNDDDSGTDLTVNGGLQLFDFQQLISSVSDFNLFTDDTGMDFIIPGEATPTNLGPLVSNPTNGPGSSVIYLANCNTVSGLRIDGANAAGTDFGNGISNPLPFQEARILNNTFTNYVTAMNLQNVSGDIRIQGNTATGLAGLSENGLILTTGNASETNLLVSENTISSNGTVGVSVTVAQDAVLNADNPTGFNGSGNPAIQSTGIVDNEVTDNGEGISIVAKSGSTANLIVENNTSSRNSTNGLRIQADGSFVNLRSLRGNVFNANLENGAFIHYLNGGTFQSITEDLNGDGVPDAAEVGSNNILDFGIASNTMSNNSIAGLCIYGEDDSTGIFDIGGPDASLGNTFIGNTGAGVAVDLRDDATAQIDALFNTVQGGGSSTPGVTIVLDFIEAAQSPVASAGLFGFDINTFDVTNFGFAATDSALVQNAVLQTVQNHFYGIPTVSDNPNSPIPDGMQLDIDFVIGDAGVAPSNGATEYYAINIGDSTPADLANGALGGIAILDGVRDAQGVGPFPGFVTGDFVGNVYANSLTTLQPLNPPNAYAVMPDIIPQPISEAPAHAARALTSGNLTFTRRAISLVTAHEIGHTLSLEHVDDTGAITLNGGLPIMGTPAPPFNLPVQQLIDPTEFALEATHLPEGAGDTQFQQFSIAQLASAVGLRAAGAETKNGFAINATGNSRLENSVFNNNTITGASENGIDVSVADNAVAAPLTIQGNTITSGQGRGINLHADGNGFIDADSTIGGIATNTYRGTEFSQGNTITNNQGDGFRAFASNGGTIHGNLYNNNISSNGGNGALLSIENGGTIDFGSPGDNRIIQGNSFVDNGGAGIALVSNVSATSVAQMDAVVQGNQITGNQGGGITTNLNGPNGPGNLNNNNVNLTVGGTLASQNNDLSGNADVGVGVDVAGNGKAVLDLRNTSITGTTYATGTTTGGDAIRLRRSDASLLTANIDNVTASGNAGDGLDVETQGNDKTDPNQPMVGTVNEVTWTNNNFSGNGENGARFRTRGDSQLVADGTANVVANNTQSGILVQTSENSEFGDTTGAILPPGRRVVFDGTTATGNGQDGLTILTQDESRAMMEVTSNRIAGSTDAHSALNTNGDSSFSNNGRDGIHIETEGSGSSDILITSGTGLTRLNGNGTLAGGNGLRWDARETSEATVRIERTEIVGNIAGATEDPALFGNGVLDPGEDVNGNGILDTDLTAVAGQPGIGGEDGTNDDLDTADGDGIQFNVFNRAIPTLIVGGIGRGNVIQGNGDDGIAITATGTNLIAGTPSLVTTAPNSSFDVEPSTVANIDISRPSISIVDNVIGGERDGIQAGNGGDGVSVNVLGGTIGGEAFGLDPATIDTTLAGGVSLSTGVNQSGPIMQFTMQNNLVANNGRRGINLLVTGAAGERDRENGNADFDPGRFTLSNNTVVSNGTEGIFYRGDAEMNQSRVTYLANFPFPDPPFNPADNRPRNFFFYDPNQAEYQGDNVGSLAGQSAFASVAPDGEAAFLNLRTVQNSFLTVENNTVQKNGVGGVTGEGIVLSVGTGSYLAADVRDNIFGGNLEEDVRTESFLSFGETFLSVEDTGDQTYDAIYHDDSAQMDLRFFGNTGNQIALSSDGATYTGLDIQKVLVLGSVPTNEFGVTDRDAAFFQVDNGLNLNTLGNDFINFGITQQMDATFQDAGFNLRNAADAAFPNLLFAPFLP